MSYYLPATAAQAVAGIVLIPFAVASLVICVRFLGAVLGAAFCVATLGLRDTP